MNDVSVSHCACCRLDCGAACCPALAQGIGLPGQSGDKPIEINAEQGISGSQQGLYRSWQCPQQGDVAVLADTLTAYYNETEKGRTISGGLMRSVASASSRPPKGLWGQVVYDVAKGIPI